MCDNQAATRDRQEEPRAARNKAFSSIPIQKGEFSL